MARTTTTAALARARRTRPSRLSAGAAASLLALSAAPAACPSSALSAQSAPPPPPRDRDRVPFPRDLVGGMILAPLTRGGNLPYRRLCADLGCTTASLSEMVFARSLLGGCPVERARLRRAPGERCFGVQVATNGVDEGAAAMRTIREAGTADFVDLNCGCPIREATRRGLGSALLRSPAKLGRLVAGMVDEAGGMPLTVKVRLGCEDDAINVSEVVDAVRDAGASAVTIHGRTAQSRYSRPCDWDAIRDVVRENERCHRRSGGTRLPIIGNGDILTHDEARMRMEKSGVDAVMVGRGALIKPWIFKEHAEGAAWDPDAADRIAIYRTLSLHMKDHFGDDARGKRMAWHFLPWHFEFLCRYEPSLVNSPISEDAPLIQRRVDSPRHDAPPLERLLSCRDRATHERVAERLWESSSDADAVRMLTAFAESSEFERMQASAEETPGETQELANVPGNDRRGRSDDRRRGRNPKPQRTPEEIRVLRAERAAKKAARSKGVGDGAEGGDDEVAPVGPLKDQRGVLKRWIVSGRDGPFGFVGIAGVRGEYLARERAFAEKMLPIDEGALPLAIAFDTELAPGDGTGSDRVVRVRPAPS